MFEQELNVYWKKVVDTIKDGIMIVDTGGTIVSANRALERITGYSRDEMIGKSCAILNCNIFDNAREKKGDHWCTLFKTGTLNMRKCTFIRRNKAFIHVLKNATLLHDKEGKVMGAVETITDITEILEKDYQIEVFRRELRSEDGFQGILGTSGPMKRVYDLIANSSQSDAPVVIFGESGTGKELVAKAIHELGRRRTESYVKVNCASLNEGLLESELFGHVKGAFTGAVQNRMGRFEAANKGDIFLDEIGDLPLSTQVKLLRVFEEKVIERVGANRPISINVRIISATNRNLKELVGKGHFREDLFYRINVIPITVPPLRERVEDIPLLAESFFRRVQLKSNKNIEGISPETMRLLMAYSWPGNVRELKSAFEYAFVTCRNETIQPYHLPPSIYQDQQVPKPPRSTPREREEIKKKELIRVLEQTGGNQSKAAKIIGISRVTVWNRIKRYQLNNRYS